MSVGLAAMVNSFLMTNMAPQHAKFNQVIWRNLETKTRNWSGPLKPLYVITGSIFDKDGDGSRDSDADAILMRSTKTKKARVAVPTHFYKILVHECSDGGLISTAFVLPHNNRSYTGKNALKYLNDRVVAIVEIEQVTAITFHPDADLDKTATNGMWDLKVTRNSVCSD